MDGQGLIKDDTPLIVADALVYIIALGIAERRWAVGNWIVDNWAMDNWVVESSALLECVGRSQ